MITQMDIGRSTTSLSDGAGTKLTRSIFRPRDKTPTQDWNILVWKKLFWDCMLPVHNLTLFAQALMSVSKD